MQIFVNIMLFQFLSRIYTDYRTWNLLIKIRECDNKCESKSSEGPDFELHEKFGQGYIQFSATLFCIILIRFCSAFIYCMRLLLYNFMLQGYIKESESLSLRYKSWNRCNFVETHLMIWKIEIKRLKFKREMSFTLCFMKQPSSSLIV